MHLRILAGGHIFNPIWHSHDDRRRRRKGVIAEAKMRYLKIFANEARSIRPRVALSQTSEKKEDERVFTLWLQGESDAPPVVKACFRSMRRHCSMPLVVLDENNLFDWISLPQHIMEKWRKGIINRTHFSDICRIELLYEHGGVWADATDYFTSPIPEDILDQDFFLFMAGDNIKLGGTHAFVQSCFIRARKGDPLIAMWRQMLFAYWEKEDSLLDYFTLHFLFRFLVENNGEAAHLFASMPRLSSDLTHVLWWQFKDETYSPELYRKNTEQSFFQKTTYKDASARSPRPGSVAEYLINS